MTVTILSSTTVHVQWNPPLTPNGVIVFYTIYVNGAPKLNVTAIAGVQSSPVDGFSPNQMLRITLSASTKMGEGPQTVPHTVTTHESGNLMQIAHNYEEENRYSSCIFRNCVHLVGCE